MRVLIVYAIALALDAHLSLIDLFVVVPIALLLAMIPISFASWGIREATFIYFLGQLGLSFEMAFSISVLFGVHRALFGAAGGLVWIGVGTRKGIFAVHPLAS
jgi:glycosyltransferase 2 family protein